MKSVTKIWGIKKHLEALRNIKSPKERCISRIKNIQKHPKTTLNSPLYSTTEAGLSAALRKIGLEVVLDTLLVLYCFIA